MDHLINIPAKKIIGHAASPRYTSAVCGARWFGYEMRCVDVCQSLLTSASMVQVNQSHRLFLGNPDIGKCRDEKCGVLAMPETCRRLRATSLTNRAFTLIELLVTIGIIAVLAGLLLPAISAGNRRGKTAQCLNNHRQIILAIQLYTTEHDGEFPSNVDGVDGQGVGTNWVAGSMIRPGESTNTALLVDPRYSLLAESLPTPRVYKCPSESSGFVRSYSMNCRINPVRAKGEPSFTGGNGQGYEVFRTLQQIQNPSDILVTLDERWETINDGYFAIDMSNTGTLDGKGVSLPYYLVDFPGNYHDNAAMVSFADGHVESHRWLESSTIPKPGMNRFPVYTHPQDRDMAWLQAHCTYKRQP